MINAAKHNKFWHIAKHNGRLIQNDELFIIQNLTRKIKAKRKIEIEYYYKLSHEYHEQLAEGEHVTIKIERIQNLLCNLHKQIRQGQTIRSRLPQTGIEEAPKITGITERKNGGNNKLRH